MTNLVKKAERANVSLDVLKGICKAIEENQIFVIASDSRNRAKYLEKDKDYIFNWTRVLNVLGYTHKVSGDEYLCRYNPLAPNDTLEKPLAGFLIDCINAGIYEGGINAQRICKWKTTNPQIIWI